MSFIGTLNLKSMEIEEILQYRDGYGTKEIKIRIVISKEAFNRKISLLTSNLNIELRRNWLDVMFGALLYMAQRPGH